MREGGETRRKAGVSFDAMKQICTTFTAWQLEELRCPSHCDTLRVEESAQRLLFIMLLLNPHPSQPQVPLHLLTSAVQ